MNSAWPWVALALLGAYHGLNPAMGWLFALALGLQERRSSALLGALWPIALGHAATIAIAVLLLRFVQHFLPLHTLKWPVAAIIFVLGLYRLGRASHPRGSGMRVGARDLFLWSFLMASAHGAGLMLIPILISHPALGMSHAMAGAFRLGLGVILFSTLVHTAAMMVVASVLALVFFQLYDRIGLQVLRHAWLNFDLLWACALLIAAIAVAIG